MGNIGRSIIYRPITLNYLFLLFFTTLTLILILTYAVPIMVKGLMMPPTLAIMIFYLSLLGSYINFPIKYVETIKPEIEYREIRIFGVRWMLPEFTWNVKRMIIAVNLGGAIIPTAISIYLLIFNIPMFEAHPLATYMKIIISMVIITVIVNRQARIVPGLGIAIPGYLPPILTAIVALILSQIPPKSNPTFIAYISGTIGTLLGADILNLHKIGKMNARMVSIGGAGTFDGIYISGLMATALILAAT